MKDNELINAVQAIAEAINKLAQAVEDLRKGW